MNPYAAPQSTREAAPKPISRELKFARVVFYVHLLVILAYVVLAQTAGAWFGPPKSVPYWLVEFLGLCPFVAACNGCPVLMCIAAVRMKDRSVTHRVGIVALDLMLSVFQGWMMLPLVQ